MTEQLPLSGLSIGVTRPRGQAAQLSQLIEQAGGLPVMFPLLEISPATDSRPLSSAISRLDEFNLAIFISPNAVEYGMPAILAAGPLPPLLKFAAVGQSTARALQDLGTPAVIAPQDKFDSEALLSLPELNNVAGWRIAIFRGDTGRELLGDVLRERGAQVEYIPCYQRSKPQLHIEELLGAKVDALTISSSEALNYLWDSLDESARMELIAVPLFVPHRRIAEAARSLGWHQVIETTGGDHGMLAGLAEWAIKLGPV